MSDVKKTLVILFISLFIINILIHTVYAQENNTTETSKENAMMYLQNASFSETTQKSELTKEDILIEAQRSFDRSLSILNIVATIMGVVIALCGIIVAVGAATGYFGLMGEVNKWKKIRENTKEDADVILNLKNKMEEIVNGSEEMSRKLLTQSFSEKPSTEVLDQLDELSRKMELLEILGASLKPEDYINRGYDLFYKGKYELALKAFEKALELKPNDATVWNNKASTLGNLNRLDEALKAVEKATELKPNYASAWYNKGLMLVKLDRFDEALKAYDKAIEIKPDSVFVWQDKVVILIKLDRFDEALKASDKTIELKLDDASTWYTRGVTLGKLDRLDEALKAYDKAIELDPNIAEVWYNRAGAYSKKEEKENAISSLKKAIGLDMSYKEKAKKDKDFENLWTDLDFNKLVD